MADSGDKTPAPQDDHDHDAAVGFVSPASLAARPVDAEARDLFDAPGSSHDPFSLSDPAPLRQMKTHAGSGGARVVKGRRARTETPEPAEVQAPSTLYVVYVLILLAVPTLGVAALIALLAVWKRSAPEGDFAASHFVYQQRTVWAAAFAAVAGALLIIVNIGVFILFFAAVWTLARGAYGVMKLRAGRSIPHPMAWLF